MRTAVCKQELVERILDKNIQVISFDIFDTLIHRPVTAPTDLFYLIKSDVQRILRDPSVDFPVMRTLAEVKARQLHSELEDITIHQIYEYFITDFLISKNDAQKIKELEIALETRYARPRKIMHEVFEFAKKSDKIIILTTDMYLTEQEIAPILSKCGYEGFSEIFISSQWNKTKQSGNLYREILRKLQISPKQMLHIGDNWHSDIDMAKQLGINYFYIPKTIDLFTRSQHKEYWNSYTRFNTSYSTKLLIGLCAAQLFDNPFKEKHENSFYNGNSYDFAYAALGPLFFSLVLWMLQDLKQTSHDRIFFLSRDGYLIKIIYDKMSKYFPDAPLSDYLYASRSAHKSVYLRYPWGVLKTLRDSPYNTKLDNLRGMLYTRFGLVLNDVEFGELQSLLRKEEHIPPSMLFSILTKYKIQICELAKKEFVLAENYYRSHFKRSVSPVIFDLGYLGSTVEGLCAFLGKQSLPFYFLNGSYSKKENLFLSGKLFVHYTSDEYNSLLMPFLEKITQSDEGTCIGFREEKEMVQPALLHELKDSKDIQQKHTIQKGILNFCDDCIEIFGSDLSKLITENYLVLENLMYIIKKTTAEELSMLLDSLYYSDDFGGDVPSFLSTQIISRRASHLNDMNPANQNRWYHFGQLTHRRKLWFAAKVLSKKLKLYGLLRPFAKGLKTLYYIQKSRNK